MKSTIAFLLFTALLFSACKKRDVASPAALKELKITAAKNNEYFATDLKGEISGNTVTFNIPEQYQSKSFIVDFTIDGDQLTSGGTKLNNGASILQLSNNTPIEVSGIDKTTTVYSIKINTYTDTELLISAFELKKTNNNQLTADTRFTINGDIIEGNLSPFLGKLIPTIITPATKIEIDGVTLNTSTQVDFSQPLSLVVTSSKGNKKKYGVVTNTDDLPKITINTTGGVAITSKDNYVNATLTIAGGSQYADYTGSTQIRGRGNSTWTFPKKPYRLKLTTKASMFGMSEERDWVLLANYLDGSLISNAIAMKIGQLLDMPFTNHMIPVEVTLNGTYLGNYMFTEHVEVETNRINVAGGQLLEMDDYYDEPYKFRSTNYNLPVMIKYPELTSSAQVAPIQTNFQQLENLMAASSFPNNNYKDYIDINSVANYLLVYMMTDNEELNHPKSVYIHKTATGKYAMGPIWDFDWAFGYEGTFTHFAHFNRPLMWVPGSQGTSFFQRLMQDPEVKNLVKQKWVDFKANKLTQLLDYVNVYTKAIARSRDRDYALWRREDPSYSVMVTKLNTWMQNRYTFLDSYINGL